MILEGFEVENWACIKKLAVTDLPATGVIVLHGPNRTGKSSLVQALRACLFDFASSTTSEKVKKYFPRGSGEKPTVSVTFTVGGSTYRIKKSFGSNKSEFAVRTATQAWKVEATTATEAHSRVCQLVGGDDSSKGLRQLLWLTQAEFHLPEPKKFDAGIQAQLRGILGVLQTALDDRFLERVKKRWSTWHSGQRKPDKQKLKESSLLAANLGSLASVEAELRDCEDRYRELESLLRQSDTLETERRDLEGQRSERIGDRQKCLDERERSQTRLSARKLAEVEHAKAALELQAALEEQQQRVEAATRAGEAERGLLPAQRQVEAAEQEVRFLEEQQTQQRGRLVSLREQQRSLLEQGRRVTQRLRSLESAEKLGIAREELRRAEEQTRQLSEFDRFFLENPVPDKAGMESLQKNRQRVLQLQAARDAASMSLTVMPEPGASPAELTLDGGPAQPLTQASPAFPVRRKAELHIPQWGRVTLSRGTSQGDFDQIEAELERCEAAFTGDMARFGLASGNPDALDQLVRRQAEVEMKQAERKKQASELKKMVPQGLEPLRQKVLELEARAQSTGDSEGADLPSDRQGLEERKSSLEGQVQRLGEQITLQEKERETAENRLSTVRNHSAGAKAELARREAMARTLQEALGRLGGEEELSRQVDAARAILDTAQKNLQQTELTHAEATVDERLGACQSAVEACDRQIRANEEKYNRIKGRLEGSEGLHAQRTALGARVDELARLTERETLEKDSVDLLYGLFEECREKQLGTLMGPIHDRVLSWMRVLELGDYKEMRFGDAFLPEKLFRRDGTAEFSVDEESTGAQEQIGILVRLALGSILTTGAEPTVAVLDDPLTHCDVGRLNKMRVILRRASEGDPHQTPQAGPLQILVLTCHPEWFRDERATVIDLENGEVMQRYPG